MSDEPKEMVWKLGDSWTYGVVVKEAREGNREYGKQLLGECAETLLAGESLHPVLALYLGECLSDIAEHKKPAQDNAAAQCLNLVRKKGYESQRKKVEGIDRARVVWDVMQERPGISNEEAYRRAADRTELKPGTMKKVWVNGGWGDRADAIFLRESAKPLSPEVVAEKVAEAYGITVSDLKRRKRGEDGSWAFPPRLVVMYLCRELGDSRPGDRERLTDGAIKGLFDSAAGQDVSNAYEWVAEKRGRETEFDDLLKSITARL